MRQRDQAQEEAFETLKICTRGSYRSKSGRTVHFRDDIRKSIRAKESIPPEQVLPPLPEIPPRQTRVQIRNETTLNAAKSLFERRYATLALNFANGFHPGGGFTLGASAQEESLCRCSGLYPTLCRDPMYADHQSLGDLSASDWAILSPFVPVFRSDEGHLLEEPWPLSILSCAAPEAHAIGQDRGAAMMEARIERILHIAAMRGFDALVLGAWGCGAFGNDPRRIARLFRNGLEGPFAGVFQEIVFAIADWSRERRTLAPFCEVFDPAPDRPTGS